MEVQGLVAVPPIYGHGGSLEGFVYRIPHYSTVVVQLDMARAAAVAALLMCANALPIDLSGHWDLDGSSENYNVTAVSVAAGTFSVLCVGGPCTAWKTASLNIT